MSKHKYCPYRHKSYKGIPLHCRACDALTRQEEELIKNLRKFMSNKGSKLELHPFDRDRLVRKYKMSSDDIEAICYYAQKRLSTVIVVGLDDIINSLTHPEGRKEQG